MPLIALVCPKCNKQLFVEEASRYYDAYYGCTIGCPDCGLTLIGVDLSICVKCERVSKQRCKSRLTCFVIPK